MSKLVIRQPSVLIGAVPLFAVNSIRLTEQYALPEVGAKGLSQSTGKITRTIDIDAVLIGDDRQLLRIALEQMADLSKLLPATQPIVNGIPLVAGLTTLLDCQINSMTFSQSATGTDGDAERVDQHSGRHRRNGGPSERQAEKGAVMTIPVLALSYPDETLNYLALPVSGDDGLPQAFLLDIGGVVYRLILGVSFTDPDLVLDGDLAGSFFDLPDADHGLYPTLRVEVENLSGPLRLVGAQRIVPELPLRFGPLRVRFSRMKVAQPNLCGPGQFGSELVGEVAVDHA